MKLNFRDCTGPPIIHQPDHLDQEIIIDDSFLFMACYSDGLSKVLSMTGNHIYKLKSHLEFFIFTNITFNINKM